MQQVDVQFETGRDVLNAYWGYLSDGGLVIRPDRTLDVGQSVALGVTISSSNSRYAFAARVVKHRDDGTTVIAFRPGEPHDMLLTEALAETDHVPPRRHHRYPVDAEGMVRGGGGDEPVRVVNISASGCCVRLAEANRLDVGSQIEVQSAGFRATGTVVWSRHKERGIRFDEEREPDVRRYVGDCDPDE